LPNLFQPLVPGRPPSKGPSGTYLVVLDWEKDKTTLRFFEKRLVLLVEIDITNKTLAGVVGTLFVSNDWIRNLGDLLSEVERLAVEANSVCHR